MGISKLERRKKALSVSTGQQKRKFVEEQKQLLPFTDVNSRTLFIEQDKEILVEVSSKGNPLWDEKPNVRVKRKKKKQRKQERKAIESDSEEDVESFDEKLKSLGYKNKRDRNIYLPIKRKWKLPGEVAKRDVDEASRHVVDDLHDLVGVFGQDVDEKDEEETILEDLVLGSTVETMKAESTTPDVPAVSASNITNAWEDDDDYQLGVTKRRERMETLLGTPSWAQLDRAKDSDDDDDEMIQRVGNVLGEGKRLPSRHLVARRCRPLNWATRDEGSIIKVAKFHPKTTTALVAGSSGVSSIIQVDKDNSKKLDSVVFKDFPIRCASFMDDGDSFMVTSGINRHAYCYNLKKGKVEKVTFDIKRQHQMLKKFIVSDDGKLGVFEGNFGNVHLFSIKSREWIDTVQFGGVVSTLTFSADDTKFFAHTDIGEVFVYDVHNRSCVNKFVDDGCIHGTSLSASPNGQMLACGSDSGIVNVYNYEDVLSAPTPKPIKVFGNLVTSVTTLEFNRTSEVFAMASVEKNNAVRLAHFPSSTVFQNFPETYMDLQKINCVDFSINSGYMSIGSNNGTAYLYRLQHFDSF